MCLNWCEIRMWVTNFTHILNTLCVVDCGPPVAPQRGSLESFISTTESSVVFFGCGPGLVPEGRMIAVCTRNGWSPNPADLSCAGICLANYFKWGKQGKVYAIPTCISVLFHKPGICAEFLQTSVYINMYQMLSVQFVYETSEEEDLCC